MHILGKLFQSILSIITIVVLSVLVNVYFQLAGDGVFYGWLLSILAIYLIVITNLTIWGKFCSKQFRVAFFIAVGAVAISVTIHSLL